MVVKGNLILTHILRDTVGKYNLLAKIPQK